ncbi:MAG: imidazole glycerol phosphate synthase subunit HisH [Rhodospirillaceae bacterium]|jgi:imidazole glycerol-phosphate synthase subunit HisH|nr:imidazole glycerol phosphate synthase subunit HisH [Rhodospirillaceae bacterium]MBT4937620.1 imidazole glycerol phosphate synthase subunit HisH [Rhodospirillaceae bacterium]MBT7957189.1 imidazole glycerol phosphate synthase subunit HisH [Rhodospirillaceae bacterium]
MAKTVIIDYGSGNLRSVAKAFEHASMEDVVVTNDPAELGSASHIVLPGVGAFADCKAGLEAVPGMIEALAEQVTQNKKPFLGICVGMQLVATRGLEHGETSGFNWISGDVVEIKPSDTSLKIPHMGWNALQFEQDAHPVLAGFEAGVHAYFVHSYHFAATNSDQVLAEVEYGGAVTAMIGRDNMIGTQFHPEKSQHFGLAFIENFLKWSGELT